MIKFIYGKGLNCRKVKEYVFNCQPIILLIGDIFLNCVKIMAFKVKLINMKSGCMTFFKLCDKLHATRRSNITNFLTHFQHFVLYQQQTSKMFRKLFTFIPISILNLDHIKLKSPVILVKISIIKYNKSDLIQKNTTHQNKLFSPPIHHNILSIHKKKSINKIPYLIKTNLYNVHTTQSQKNVYIFWYIFVFNQNETECPTSRPHFAKRPHL